MVVAPECRLKTFEPSRPTNPKGPISMKEPPAILVEWTTATQNYVDAREANEPLGPALTRLRKAWLAIKDDPGFEPSDFALELMAEVMRPLQ